MMFCDLKCRYAESARAEMDGARSCMTFTALYCTLHERHVMKSQPCPDREDNARAQTGEKRTVKREK